MKRKYKNFGCMILLIIYGLVFGAFFMYRKNTPVEPKYIDWVIKETSKKSQIGWLSSNPNQSGFGYNYARDNSVVSLNIDGYQLIETVPASMGALKVDGNHDEFDKVYVSINALTIDEAYQFVKQFQRDWALRQADALSLEEWYAARKAGKDISFIKRVFDYRAINNSVSKTHETNLMSSIHLSINEHEPATEEGKDFFIHISIGLYGESRKNH